MNRRSALLQNTLLVRLWRQNRASAVLVALFGSGMIFFNMIRLETSPFFVWNMYAPRMDTTASFSLLEIHAGKRILRYDHSWMQPQWVVTHDPLQDYLNVMHFGRPNFWQNFLQTSWMRRHPAFKSWTPALVNDSLAYQEFPKWYARYVRKVLGNPPGAVVVLQKSLRYDSRGFVQETGTDTVLFFP